MTASSTCLALDDLDSFEEYRSNSLQHFPQFCVCLLSLGSDWDNVFLGRKTTKGKHHSYHILSSLHAINMTSDFNLDHLTEMLFVGFFTVKILFLPYP